MGGKNFNCVGFIRDEKLRHEKLFILHAQITTARVFLIRKVTAANVGRLSRRREQENWEFRDYLRECGMDTGRIDAIVHELYRQASSEFDCRTCANCCKSESPMLDDEDIGRLSKKLDMAADRFVSEYLIVDEEYDGFIFNRKPCPFLEDNLCTCYDSRPRDCASYPHMHKDRFASRLSNTVANCSVCPIVFTVYERLKEEIRQPQK